MRTLTAAQLRTLQGQPAVKIIAASATEGFYYTTYPDTSATLGFYNSGMELDDYEIEIDPVGGMSTVGDMQIRILNADDAFQFIVLETGGGVYYLENDEITISLIADSDTHTLYQGVINDWTIDNEYWTINITDETNKFNVEILTEITKENFPNTYDETVGKFVPLLYCVEGSGKYPAYNVNIGFFKLIYANHTIIQNGAGLAYIYDYEDQIETYALLVDLVSQADTITTTAFTRYYDAAFRIANYNKFIISSRTDSSFADDFHLIIDGASGTELVMGESLILGFSIDIADLGFIVVSTDVDIYIVNDTRTGTPAIQQYSLDDTTSYSSQTINADSFLYNSTPKAGGGVWTFNDFNNFEFEIVTGAGEAISVQEVYVNLTYRKYSKTPKQYVRRNVIIRG